MSSDKASFLAQPVVKSIYVYRNGDAHYGARRLVIHEKRVANFDSLLKEVTSGVQAPFGAVRNIYTPLAGHRVSCLEQLRSGGCYVAAGGEKFKKLDYSQIGCKKKVLQSNSDVTQIKQVPRNRIITSARFLKPLKEPCLIFIVANGDVLTSPARLLVPQRILDQYERILEMVTEKMGFRVLGGVHSLYTFDGGMITGGKELESGQFYVAAGREKFKKRPYTDLIFTKPEKMWRFIGSKAASLPPIDRTKRQNGRVKRDSSPHPTSVKVSLRKSAQAIPNGVLENGDADQAGEEDEDAPDADIQTDGSLKEYENGEDFDNVVNGEQADGNEPTPDANSEEAESDVESPGGDENQQRLEEVLYDPIPEVRGDTETDEETQEGQDGGEVGNEETQEGGVIKGEDEMSGLEDEYEEGAEMKEGGMNDDGEQAEESQEDGSPVNGDEHREEEEEHKAEYLGQE